MQRFLEEASQGSLFALFDPFDFEDFDALEGEELDDIQAGPFPEGRLRRPFNLLLDEFGTQPVGKFDMINHLTENGFTERAATNAFNGLLKSPEKFIRVVPEDEARFARKLRFTEESLSGKTDRDIKDTNIIQELKSGLENNDN